MKESESIAINGVITSVSVPIDYVERGMHFYFDGKTLSVIPDTVLDDGQLFDLAFREDFTSVSRIDVMVEGEVRPSGGRIIFHVSSSVGIKDRGVRLAVIAYWLLDDGRQLEEIGRLSFGGLCIDSFCPMTNVETEIEEGHKAITAIACSENIIDLGSAVIDGKSLRLSAESYWTYEVFQRIAFESRLHCEVDSPTYELMKKIYMSVASALRFCLGRGNVDFEIDLCVGEPSSWERVGRYKALHGETYIPDEYDPAHVGFIRASNIGEHFGTIVSGFANRSLSGKELSESRRDARIVTNAKVIELTSSFEGLFRELYPHGAKHQTKTQQARNEAREALLGAAEGLRSSSKRLLMRLSERIEDDNLETKIRYAYKTFSEPVIHEMFRQTQANRENTQLGRRITTLRNDVAHGNKPRYSLGDSCEEYKLLIRLVFTMKLKRLDLPDEEIARLLRCMD